MAENLSTSLLKKQASDRKMSRTLKITQAVDYLDKAAAAFESLGFVKEAKDVLALLQKMAEGKKYQDSGYNHITMMHLRKDYPQAYNELPYEILGYPDAAETIKDMLEDKITREIVIKMESGAEIIWDGDKWKNSIGTEFLRGIDPHEQSLHPVKRHNPRADKDEIGEDDLGFAAENKKHRSSSHKEPEVFEIESLLHEPKDEEDSEEDDLGEQIIEMRSIASAALKKKV